MDLRAEKTPRGIILLDYDDENLRAVVEVLGDFANDETVEVIKKCIENMTLNQVESDEGVETDRVCGICKCKIRLYKDGFKKCPQCEFSFG